MKNQINIFKNTMKVMVCISVIFLSVSCEKLFEFDLPEAGLVKLAVFNLLGQEVASLVNGNLNAGRYNVHWNACNQKGKMVASGLYFYRLSVKPENSPRDSFMQVRKMMLTR